jgi:hypothetical protein
VKGRPKQVGCVSYRGRVGQERERGGPSKGSFPPHKKTSSFFRPGRQAIIDHGTAPTSVLHQNFTPLFSQRMKKKSLVSSTPRFTSLLSNMQTTHKLVRTHTHNGEDAKHPRRRVWESTRRERERPQEDMHVRTNRTKHPPSKTQKCLRIGNANHKRRKLSYHIFG